MCNRYLLSNSAAELARLFKADLATNQDVTGQVFPGGQGLVIAEGKAVTKEWGFPLNQISKKTGKPLKPKPVNNARVHKLDGRFWNASFRERRCLIPVTKFAEAEGQRGAMTQTWISVAGEDHFACAGVWRDGFYSMLMTDANGEMKSVHNRMPVILKAGDYKQYLEGSEIDAIAACRPFGGGLLIERTTDLWASRA